MLPAILTGQLTIGRFESPAKMSHVRKPPTVGNVRDCPVPQSAIRQSLATSLEALGLNESCNRSVLVGEHRICVAHAYTRRCSYDGWI
jgi:hypothetical protein